MDFEEVSFDKVSDTPQTDSLSQSQKSLFQSQTGSSSNKFSENPKILVPPQTEIVFVDQPLKPVKSNIITLLILMIFRDLKTSLGL